MAKRIDSALAEKLRQESEKTKDDAYPQGARGSRPNRTKVYSVRLSDQEEDEIQKLAQSKHFQLLRSFARGFSNASTSNNLRAKLVHP
jgi:hypothetical protein